MKATKARGGQGGKSGGTKPQQGAGKAQSDQSPVSEVRPLKPQRTWLAVLSITFALWVGGMLTIYFVEIHPHRGQPPVTPLPSPSTNESILGR